MRARLSARHVVSGVALGLAFAVVPAAIGWATRNHAVRVAAPAVAIVGGAAGAWVARRRRWSDTEVALYLDEQLGTPETITTAVGMRADRVEGAADDPSDASDVVFERAAHALRAARPNQARPVVLRPVHAALPMAAAALVALALAPREPPATVVTAKALAATRVTDAEGLAKVVALAHVDARDDAQRKRLEALAKDAEKLRDEVRKGLEPEGALGKIARLRDAIVAERLSLGDGEARGGLESAVAKLGENAVTKRAGEALGEHDAKAMDEEMERIANEREKGDRTLAQRALSDAARAAAQGGAKEIEKSLLDSKDGLEARGRRAALLRDLAQAMKEAGAETSATASALERLDREATDSAAKQLAEAMAKALEKLTPEERKRLAEKLAKMAAKGATQSDPAGAKKLAKELESGEGQKELEDRLKGLANEDDEAAEAKRDDALDSAQEGADEAKSGLSGTPMPMPASGENAGEEGPGGPGGGKSGRPGDGEAAGSGNGRAGGKGGRDDKGTGDHAGASAPLDGETMRARAHAKLRKAPGLPGAVTTFTTGKAGGTANARGTGDLGAVGPGEVDGVEHSDVPQEYREQVRQYFQP